jgi:hypothetical protein
VGEKRRVLRRVRRAAAAELMWLGGTGDEPVELHLSCPDALPDGRSPGMAAT